MFPTAKSVKTLRAYYKNKGSPQNAEAVSRELFGESDRAAIILSSTFLEDALVYRLSQCLTFSPNDDQFEYIFRFEGPLGTFSARIEIAFMFGFIDRQTRDQLDTLRELRNACAHSLHPISFATSELANVARRMFHPYGYMKLSDGGADDIRNSFSAECAVLLQILGAGSRTKGIESFIAKLAERVALPPSLDIPP